MMTLIAGMYGRQPGYRIDPASRARLAVAVSRHASDRVLEAGDDRCALVKVDVGAFGAPAAAVGPGGAFSAITGEPLFERLATPRLDRSDDFRAWQSAGADGDWELLRRARGVFSAVHYDPARQTLTLATDKLGIRPLYVAVTEELVVFASALRILEQLPEAALVMDVRGTTELVSFGFALGTRTGYVNVSMLRAAERLTVVDGRLESAVYWRWDEVRPETDVETLALRAYDAFLEGVALRVAGDRGAIAFLSGGLDSRAIAVALHARGLGLHTFNFAREGTLDRQLGAGFARALGSLHEERPMTGGESCWAQLLADAWASSSNRGTIPVARPQLAWSGDGGSVGLGHVYISREVASDLAAGRTNEAIAAYLQEQSIQVPRRLLTPAAARALVEPWAAVRAELAEIRGTDRVRAFHLYLMLNDQRRHLANHFEEIDVHRLEFQLPFFDSRVLEAVTAAPAEACLGHDFYMRWFSHFPAVARSTPWQTYPGHIACPLPVGKAAIYQWSERNWNVIQWALRRKRLADAAGILAARDFPARLIRRGYLRLAVWRCRFGLRTEGTLFDVAVQYYRHWHYAGGRHWPALTQPAERVRAGSHP